MTYVEKRGIYFWGVVVCSLGGEGRVGMGKKKEKWGRRGLTKW
jgi:hypothetical protein